MAEQASRMRVTGLMDDLRQISPDGTFHILTKDSCLVLSPDQDPTLVPMAPYEARAGIEDIGEAYPEILPLYCAQQANDNSGWPQTQRQPPGFGDGQAWQKRVVEWYERNPKGPQHSSVVIAKGTPVTETFNAAYWQARQTAADLLEHFGELGFDSPYQFVLVTEDGSLVGTGGFDASDGADEMAWITCMFLELGLMVAFAAASTPPCSHLH
jgi:hypothetical protein